MLVFRDRASLGDLYFITNLPSVAGIVDFEFLGAFDKFLVFWMFDESIHLNYSGIFHFVRNNDSGKYFGHVIFCSIRS